MRTALLMFLFRFELGSAPLTFPGVVLPGIGASYLMGPNTVDVHDFA
jgi:hypothetical protein